MGRTTNEELLASINNEFEGQVQVVGEPYGLLTLETSAESLIPILSFLKTDATLQFIYLTDITAIHYPEQEKQIGVIYHVHSLVNNIRIRIKVFIDGDNCHIPTATTLWNGANWMERPP
jgi:NADH-quinone oxidoreductase subunit C